jgi:hypothetical protein
MSLFGKKEKPYKAPGGYYFKRKKLVIMSYLDNILFALLLVIGFGYFSQA